MADDVVEVVLPNNTVALVRVAEVDRGGGPAEKVGWKDSFDFEHVSGMLEGVSEAVKSGLVKVRPSKTTVELGIDFAVRNGRLTGMLVDGKASASLRVTLEWGDEGSPDGADKAGE